MNGIKVSNDCGHIVTKRTISMSVYRFLFLATVFALLPAIHGSVACSFNWDGNCTVNAGRDEVMELLKNENQTINWKIRPQNIGFMYYLRTSDEGDDVGIRGIVKWKVQLKYWSTNDTTVEGFLVSIVDHDTNDTVASYELNVPEPFEEFADNNEILEMRLEVDDVLKFNKRYDAKINILPIGKQAAASSFLSVMEKLDNEHCSAKTGLAERWAPRIMVDVFEATSEIEAYWKPAPSFLCIKSYELVLLNREGNVLNTTEVEVIPGQKIGNATFGGIEKDQMVQVKIRGKTASDGGCACVNCNCITDKSRFFVIPHAVKKTVTVTTPKSTYQHEQTSYTVLDILCYVFGTLILIALIFCSCLCCTKHQNTIFKQKVAFNALKTNRYPNKKVKAIKSYKVMVVCPEVTGRDYDYMMRIAEGLKKSSNTVVCDKWKESSRDVEENMLHWVYEQIRLADKILVFHSDSHIARVGVYEIMENFYPSTDPRLIHVALTPSAQKNVPREIQYVMPRDQKHLEEAFGMTIENPLVIDIPSDDMIVPEHGAVHRDSCESILEGQQNSKTHSTDSGVSSMSSNSSQSGGSAESAHKITDEILLKDMVNVESHPLLQQSIEVV
ncbi:Protein CBG07774 [Caenorhabditis briggsae]|uniref:Protein CBG07774 n=2 Tax=Caenorhabditis briggsae TaxID=6238 RepID=A8X441_CAEBR|nr:Protein CBG07774 [Caenorhabditis briggsae]ULT84339.1 hypothetical protein L3Y34_013189 [Caenorhabditis briggsae]CAP27401.2 Protein CBG07774 [Caenorhabditis briggsae]